MSKISRAQDITIKQYLDYPQLKIPLFQREYVWDTENIEEFWDDLVSEQIEFLGSFILKDTNFNSDSGKGYLEIVDGQQRTISLLILLATIARQLESLVGTGRNSYEKNARLQANKIREFLYETNPEDMTQPASYKLVLPSEEDNDVLREVLSGIGETENLSDGQKMFLKASEKLNLLAEDYLKTFRNKEEKIQALVQLKNKITSIKIIQILVQTDEDAYTIFETVNARGADLGAAELLKNHLFSRLAYPEEQKKIHEEWQRIKKTLSEIDRRSLDLTGLLRYYWIGKYNHVSKKSLYKAIRSTLSPSNTKGLVVSPETLFEEICKFHVTIEKIFLSGIDEWKLSFRPDAREQRRAHEWFTYKESLDYFKKSIQYLPIYTSLVGNLEKIDQHNRSFIELLLAVEKINFIYSFILQEPTNKIDKLLSGIGRDIDSAIQNGGDVGKAAQSGKTKIESLLREVVRRESVDKFISELSWKKSNDKQIMYFILINLEHQLGGYARPMVKDDLSLEHVYPKSVEVSNSVEGWSVPDFDYAQLGHGIGNITLLPRSGPQANGSAGERAFVVKRDEFLLPSNFSINRYFENLSSWGKDEIHQRLQEIQKLVWERWGWKD